MMLSGRNVPVECLADRENTDVTQLAHPARCPAAMTDLEAAWAAAHENTPEGWYVGKPGGYTRPVSVTVGPRR